MKITEDNFIEELKYKNEDALYYFIENYGWIIKTVMSRYLFYLEEYKDECFNDCLLGIWNNIDSYDGDRSSFTNWVSVIARYNSIDYVRKYLKYKEEKNIEDFNIESEDIIDEILRKEVANELNNMLKNLSKKDQMLFEKFYFKNKTANDISKETNMTEENIYTRLSRGRKKMKDIFEGRKNNG